MASRGGCQSSLCCTGPTWHWEKTLPFLLLNSHTDPRTLLGARQECTIQFTAPASRALRASLWQRRMMVKPLQFINYAKAINALSKQLPMFGQPGSEAAPALTQRGWAPGEGPLSSRAVLGQWQHSVDQQDGRKKGGGGGKSSKHCSGVVFLCSTYLCVCVCVCAGHTLHWHVVHTHPSDSLCAGVMPKREKKDVWYSGWKQNWSDCTLSPRLRVSPGTAGTALTQPPVF